MFLLKTLLTMTNFAWPTEAVGRKEASTDDLASLHFRSRAIFRTNCRLRMLPWK